MCLYPEIRQNPRYKKNQKNGGVIPPIIDKRVLYVPIKCNRCIECRKQKAKEWQIRLQEDLKTHTNGKFVAFTFSNENYTKIKDKLKPKGYKGYDLDNAIATFAVRKFTERWRKKYKKTIRHWLITELGHGETEHLHLHGIVWTDEDMKEVEAKWQYGWVWKGKKILGQEKLLNYVTARTVNYIIKYVTKVDEQHKEYKSIILSSNGIGGNYTNTINAYKNKYKEKGKTEESYRTSTGHKMNMPIYWRNKIYTDEEKELLWIEKLDRGYRYIMGEKIKADDYEQIMRTLKFHRERSHELGYGNNKVDWEQKEYENKLREMKQELRAMKDIEPETGIALAARADFVQTGGGPGAAD